MRFAWSTLHQMPEMPEAEPQPERARKWKVGGLPDAIRRQSAIALASGALQPIATELHEVEQEGTVFLVRALDPVRRKLRWDSRPENNDGVDPFEPPYRDDLYLGDLSATHVALLNKFNVVNEHLLIVTRAFEPQQSVLTRADFAAVAVCLAEIDALAFYNAGPEAGASQPHKHLQLVALPLCPEGSSRAARVPIAPLLQRRGALRFTHALESIEGCFSGPVDEIGARLESLHVDLLRRVSCLPRDTESGAAGAGALDRHCRPYSLLLTREWMLVVPRVRDMWNGISVNALGFAGAFFVKNERDLLALREAGPLAALEHVAAVGC